MGNIFVEAKCAAVAHVNHNRGKAVHSRCLDEIAKLAILRIDPFEVLVHRFAERPEPQFAERASGAFHVAIFRNDDLAAKPCRVSDGNLDAIAFAVAVLAEFELIHRLLRGAHTLNGFHEKLPIRSMT
jgi:hypothetical protein